MCLAAATSATVKRSGFVVHLKNRADLKRYHELRGTVKVEIRATHDTEVRPDLTPKLGVPNNE